ncbi:phage tail protein, partial [Escherichia coli]
TLSRVDSDYREKLQSSTVSDALAGLKTSANNAINRVKDSLNGLF